MGSGQPSPLWRMPQLSGGRAGLGECQTSDHAYRLNKRGKRANVVERQPEMTHPLQRRNFEGVEMIKTCGNSQEMETSVNEVDGNPLRWLARVEVRW